MNMGAELEKHAAEELTHALIIAGQIDYLGGMPLAVPNPVKIAADAQDMLRFDLDNENETIHHYRQCVRQCGAFGKLALAEHIPDILVQEPDHQIALANALGVQIPNVDQTQSVIGRVLPERRDNGRWPVGLSRTMPRVSPHVVHRGWAAGTLIPQESGD